MARMFDDQLAHAFVIRMYWIIVLVGMIEVSHKWIDDDRMMGGLTKKLDISIVRHKK